MAEKKKYKLTGNDNKTYESDEPGTLGGHSKLKIYGKLDCPSALRAIEKGQYVKYRVFFKDEETAIAAGYRPCAKCCPTEYREWKNMKLLQNDACNIDKMESFESGKAFATWTCDGVQHKMTFSKLKKLWGYADEYEYCSMGCCGQIIYALMCVASGQGGVLFAWDAATEKIIHCSEALYANATTLSNDGVFCIYRGVAYYGMPYHDEFSMVKLGTMDAWKKQPDVSYEVIEGSMKNMNSTLFEMNVDGNIIELIGTKGTAKVRIL